MSEVCVSLGRGPLTKLRWFYSHALRIVDGTIGCSADEHLSPKMRDLISRTAFILDIQTLLAKGKKEDNIPKLNSFDYLLRWVIPNHRNRVTSTFYLSSIFGAVGKFNFEALSRNLRFTK